MALTACTESQPEASDQFAAAVKSKQRPDNDVNQDRHRKPAELLRLLEIKPGMIIADIKAGEGYFSELFNYLVQPDGQVYLHNLPTFIEKNSLALDQRLSNDRLANVTLVPGNMSDFKLPQPADVLFLSNVVHDLYKDLDSLQARTAQSNFFHQLRVNLKPNGQVVVIDHAAPEGSQNYLTEKLHRIDPSYLVEQFKSEGFELIKTSNLLENPDDSLTEDIWQSEIRGNTSRFIFIFQLSKDKEQPAN